MELAATNKNSLESWLIVIEVRLALNFRTLKYTHVQSAEYARFK